MYPKSLAAKALTKAIIFSALVLPSIAIAGIPVADGLNLSQTTVSAFEAVAQTLVQADQYAKQIEQFNMQIDQYANQVQNTARPDNYLWDDASSVISNIIQTQDMLDYYANRAGSLDAYLDKYQDAEHYQSSSCFTSSGCTASEKSALDANRIKATQDQKAANDAMLKGINQQQTNLQSDAHRLKQLQAAAETADGQVKAIQFASQISGQQANQLLQIRALLMAQQTAQATSQQAQVDREAQATAAAQQLRRVKVVQSTSTEGLVQ